MFIFGLYRKALAANNLLFFLNPDDLNMFRDLGLIKEKTQIVLLPGEGISLEQFPSAQLPIEPVFLLIARLIRDKGIQEFVAAARLLRQSYPSISCRIVGPLDSNPTAFRADEVESWHREGIIEYLGEAKDIRQHMAAASVYVLPSYREGVPRTVLEAMSMGRPIVTTDVPGCRETVMAGENGFIVPVKDAAALAEAMERFILDPGLISKMGKRSREIAEEKFDVRKVNNLIIRSLGLDNEKGI
jgi:glycosyltransferase involved in cell wall biosynthesis